MRHKNGNMIYGVSWENLRSGDKDGRSVTWNGSGLAATGTRRFGSPVDVDDLDVPSRADYEEWCRLHPFIPIEESR